MRKSECWPLFLAGWYLLTPPWVYRPEELNRPICATRRGAKPRGAIFSVDNAESFDSAAQCQAYLDEQPAIVPDEKGKWTTAEHLFLCEMHRV
jgi:hypothetical protein